MHNAIYNSVVYDALAVPSDLSHVVEQINQVSVADFGCFMRVAHRKAPDYGIYGLLELLANFWQNGFFDDKFQEGESENSRVFTGDLNGGPGWT